MTNLVVHQPIEITGNLVAHYPPKKAEVIFGPLAKDFGSDWSTETPLAA